MSARDFINETLLPKLGNLDALLTWCIAIWQGWGRGGRQFGRIFQPTIQPTNLDVLCGLRVFWQSPRSCKLL